MWSRGNPKGGFSQVGLVSYTGYQMAGQEDVASGCTRGNLDVILGKISSLKRGQALEEAAQGSGAITAPESVQKAAQMWHLGVWFGDGPGSAGSMTGLSSKPWDPVCPMGQVHWGCCSAAPVLVAAGKFPYDI